MKKKQQKKRNKKSNYQGKHNNIRKTSAVSTIKSEDIISENPSDQFWKEA